MRGGLGGCWRARGNRGNSLEPGKLMEKVWKLGETVSRLDYGLWCVGNADYFPRLRKIIFNSRLYVGVRESVNQVLSQSNLGSTLKSAQLFQSVIKLFSRMRQIQNNVISPHPSKYLILNAFQLSILSSRVLPAQSTSPESLPWITATSFTAWPCPRQLDL